MDSLSKSLYSVVSSAIEQFAQVISENCELSKDDILNLWNEKASSELKVEKKSKSSQPREKKVAQKSESSSSSSSVSESQTCTYVFKKGKNNGSTCTSKVFENSEFCKKHKGKDGEGGDEKPEKAEKKPTKTKAKKDTKEKDSPVISKIKESTPSLVIRRNKHGNYEHIETGLVLDKDTKEVFGRQTESGVVNLTSDDIEQCKKYNFKYKIPETIQKSRDDDNAEDEEEEEDVEEEEEEDVEEEEDAE